MEFKLAAIEGLVEITPRQFEDERGLFWESYSQKLFTEHGIPHDFVQDNHSWSKPGVLRGLHCQHAPFEQGKLVRCITGRVLDVVVDIRPNSPTFGQHDKFILDSKLGNLLWVPGGFAHGFVALEEAVFVYKCTNYYHKASESGIRWDDPDLGIDWGVSDPIVSSKDQILPTFKEFKDQLAQVQGA